MVTLQRLKVTLVLVLNLNDGGIRFGPEVLEFQSVSSTGLSLKQNSDEAHQTEGRAD